MAQLIVLLENQFKNTLGYRPTLKNIILPYVLKKIVKLGDKPFTNLIGGLKNEVDVVEISPGDIIDSGSEDDGGSEVKHTRLKNTINMENAMNGEINKTSKQTNGIVNCNKSQIQNKQNGINESDRKRIKEEKSDSETDIFEANPDDALDFQISDNEKNNRGGQSDKKRKSGNNSSRRRKNTEIKDENESGSEYVLGDDSDHDYSDDDGSDWRAEGSSKKHKKRKINEDDSDPNKSIIQKLIDNASYFICKVCEVEVKTLAEKIKHRKSHNLRYLSYKTGYSCPKCDLQFSHSYPLRVHYEKSHSDTGQYFEWKQCTECPFKSLCRQNFKRHLSHHKRKGTFQCEYCSFSHDHKKNLTTHLLRTHNKFFLDVFSCEQCTYSSKNSHDLARHKKVHLPEDQARWIRCEECPFKTVERGNLRKHIKCHELQDGFKCPRCSYSSPYACRITDHMKLHYGKDEQVPDYNPKVQTPLHFCPKCSYKTMTKAHLDRHLTAHKTYDDRRIHCGQCPFSCKDKIDLVAHIKCHNGEGALKCPWCSFTHRAQSTMTRHRRLHSEEKEENWPTRKHTKGGSRRCPICNKLFKSPCFMKIHMLKHQALDQLENPVLCAHCPYRSKKKENAFINHVHCHFKKEGMKCKFCSFRHDRQNVMTSHMKLHKEVPVKSEPENLEN